MMNRSCRQIASWHLIAVGVSMKISRDDKPEKNPLFFLKLTSPKTARKFSFRNIYRNINFWLPTLINKKKGIVKIQQTVTLQTSIPIAAWVNQTSCRRTSEMLLLATIEAAKKLTILQRRIRIISSGPRSVCFNQIIGRIKAVFYVRLKHRRVARAAVINTGRHTENMPYRHGQPDLTHMRCGGKDPAKHHIKMKRYSQKPNIFSWQLFHRLNAHALFGQCRLKMRQHSIWCGDIPAIQPKRAIMHPKASIPSKPTPCLASAALK